MNLYTPVNLPRKEITVSHTDKIMLFGSCFAMHMGNFLSRYKFTCDVNPFGVLYNPVSVAHAIRQIIDNKRYVQKDLFEHENLFHSYMHHGDFSDPDKKVALRKINDRIGHASGFIRDTGYLLITFGTAYTYALKTTGEVVSNCHKVPSGCFNRRLLSVEDIIRLYEPLIGRLKNINRNLKLLFTVSPIRHLKEGLHGNTISKSVLLLSVEKLQMLYPDMVYYFPAYEIMIDELRDYRFYADDMCHPSSLAIHYIWDCFAKAYFTHETCEIIKSVEDVNKALNHKPIHPDTPQHSAFLRQIVLKIERLKEKYPYLGVEKELELCHTLLKR